MHSKQYSQLFSPQSCYMRGYCLLVNLEAPSFSRVSQSTYIYIYKNAIHVDNTLFLFTCIQVFLSWCCGVERCQVKDVDLLEHILLDWRIWDRAAPGVWEYLLWQLEQLITPPEVANKECPNRENYNIECFLKAGAIVRILLTSKVCHVPPFHPSLLSPLLPPPSPLLSLLPLPSSPSSPLTSSLLKENLQTNK